MTNKTINKDAKKALPSEAFRFASFLVTGGISAACNIGARFLMSRVMRYELAVLFAYLIGMIVAFILARTFVFEKGERGWQAELARFATVNVFGLSLVWLVSVGLVRLVFPRMKFYWHPEDVAHLVGVASPVFISYYAHKYFSFGSAAVNDSVTQTDEEILSEP
jgi:putative flippase GtrA